MSNESNPFQFNPTTPSTINPYAPTTNDAYLASEPTDVEQFRKKHLSHEASVKSIGTLYLLGAILMVPIGLFMLLGGAAAEPNEAIPLAAFGVFYIAVGVFQGFVGVGLRNLRGWTRIAASVLSAFGLLAIPIGTLISAYFLYLLLSEKGRIVFSDQYKVVISQTPHIKYKTSIVVWIFLGLLIALIALGVIAALVGG